MRVMQFVAELAEYEPCIWRRFQMSSNADLSDFCYALMGIFRMGVICLILPLMVRGM